MKLGRFLLTISSAALLAGCMSAPTPAGTASPWSPPARAQKPDSAWADLRAQKMDFSKPLALAELADIALQNNPATRKAWSDARAAAAQMEQAKGYFMPTVTGTAGISRNKTSASPDFFNRNTTQYGPGLQVNYLILNFGGGRSAAVEAALQTVYALDYTFNRTLQDVLIAVETAYYGLISAQGGVTAAEANTKDTATALEAARIRKSAGTGTELDVLQAQALNDQAQYNLANAQGQVQIARGRLAQALGIPADIPVQVVEPTAEVADTLAPQDLQRMIDDALQRRPDIAALRATVRAKKATAKAVGSELWPSLYFNGSAAETQFSNSTSNAVPDDEIILTAGLSLQWTLFDGFQTRNARRTAMEQAASAEAQLRLAELAASADVWASYHTYETALQKYKFSTAFLKSSSAAYDLALDSYKAGLKSILDLLNAESQLTLARSQQISSRQEAFTALANLAYSTGQFEKDGLENMQNQFSTSTEKDNEP